MTAGRGSARSTTRSVSGRSRRRDTAAGSFSRRRRLPPELVARDLSVARRFFPLAPGIEWPRFGVFTHELGASLGDLDAACRDHGVASVQLSRDQLDAWLEAPEPLAVDVAGIGAYRNLIVPDDAERRANIAYVERCLEAAPLAGTWVVSTHAGTRHPTEEWWDSPENLSPEAWSLFLDAVERLLAVAERAGTILALEGSVKSVLRTTAQVIELFDRFPSPHLGLVCDPYNFVSRHLAARPRARHRRSFSTASSTGSSSPTSRTSGRTAPRCRHPAVGTGVFAQAPYLAFLRERRPDLRLTARAPGARADPCGDALRHVSLTGRPSSSAERTAASVSSSERRLCRAGVVRLAALGDRRT